MVNQKEVGAWNYAQIIDNLEGFFLYLFTTELGWSKDEVLLMCEKARAQLKDPKV